MTLLTLLRPKPDDSTPPPAAFGRARRRGLGWWWLLLAAAMAALVSALALRNAFGTDKALVPWAEANQGLLSVLALASALAIALFENGRALRADDDDRREYVDFILSVVDGLDAFTASEEVNQLVGKDDDLEQVWSKGSLPLRFTIDSARHAVVRDPVLAVQINRLHHAMGWGIRKSNDTRISTPEQMREFLADVRAKIASRR